MLHIFYTSSEKVHKIPKIPTLPLIAGDDVIRNTCLQGPIKGESGASLTQETLRKYIHQTLISIEKVWEKNLFLERMNEMFGPIDCQINDCHKPQ